MTAPGVGNSLPPEGGVKLTQSLRILLLEDNPTDAELNERVLRKAGIKFDSLRVDTLSSFVAALDTFRPDLILADYHLPGFDGLQALAITREKMPQTPYIFVSGAMGEERAVDSIKLGAIDYIIKDRLVRLPMAVQRALEEKKAEQQRREVEEKFRKITESAQDAIIMMGADQRISFWNAAAERIFGYTSAEALGQELHILVTPAPAHAGIARAFLHFQATGEGPLIGKVTEVNALRKGGEEFPVELSISATQLNGQWHTISIVRDITARKQAEIALNHANRALATLSAVNRTMAHATDEDELLRAICQAIVQQRGYQLAWVGYAQHDADKTIKIMGYTSSDGQTYPDTMRPTWAEDESGMGPSGRAIRSSATQLCQDIADDPHYQPWRDDVCKRGYAASIALPLLNEISTAWGVLMVYSKEVNAFSLNEVGLLEEMTGDLVFGVRMLRMRQERDSALEQNRRQMAQLQNNLEDTVRAIATIVEMRDPYTSGHQGRVADLAAAIARQMGLPDEQVHGIRLAGVVHDLGKIQIPAEILSRPGRISDAEFALIKIHSQAGYDILKGIDFPWPLAQMVLQHHERLDGSGYPQGLKGDAILLGARILGVADVVEAISAHRPYRSGLGIEAALEGITKQCGIHYDSRVVDACLALFREQGYTFK